MPSLSAFLHVVEHFVGDLFRHRRPQLNDLVVALAVGDGAVKVLLLHGETLLFRFAHDRVLRLRDDHVIEADGETAAGGELEAQLLDTVEHLDRDLKAEVQVAVVDQLADALLLEQAVDVRHALGEMHR